MNRREWKFISIILLLSFCTVFFILFSKDLINNGNSGIIELSGFKSDLVKTEPAGSEIYSGDINRKEIYAAYSKYISLNPGLYQIEFTFLSEVKRPLHCIIEISTEKGKKITYSENYSLAVFPAKKNIEYRIDKRTEIEPRIKFLSGNREITIGKVKIKRINKIIPWNYLTLKSLYIFPPVFLLFTTIFLIYSDNKRWKYSLAMLLFYMGIYLVIRLAWVSEDAFITMRHVENFLSGRGPVFNVGERVEGYTHTLWFYILSFLRAVGLSPKGAMVIPGVLFSGIFLYFLFFRFKRDDETNTPSLNFSGAVLIGMSCFIDFGTSGLETSLSYLLLILFAFQIFKRSYIKKPFQFGITLTLLILNRPDFGIFFIFSILLILFEIYKKKYSIRLLMKFLLLPIVILSAYEIFRMGYYGALFPNPFYAKSGSAAYFSQGFKYFADLLKGSAFILIILISLSIFLFEKNSDRKKKNERYILFSAALFYTFFIIRGGGDFMHGRFLLPSVILLTLSSSGMFDNFFSGGRAKKYMALTLIVILFFVSRAVIPVQKRGTTGFVNGISDERYTFYHNRIIPLKDIINDDIIFMWKTIGKNYRDLSERTKVKIRVAYNTVGYIGYYSGPRVHVLDKLGLNEHFVARINLKERGRPGHEKSAPFPYLVYRGLTFGKTPFKIWNSLAETKYGTLWDLSRRTLAKFRFFLQRGFKQNLDKGIENFLKTTDSAQLKKSVDFLFFLKKFWYPYASPENKKLFLEIYVRSSAENSAFGIWIRDNRKRISLSDRIIKDKLTIKMFFKNILNALEEIF